MSDKILNVKNKTLSLLQSITDHMLEREAIENMQIIQEEEFNPSLNIVYTCGKAECYKGKEINNKLRDILNKR